MHSTSHVFYLCQSGSADLQDFFLQGATKIIELNLEESFRSAEYLQKCEDFCSNMFFFKGTNVLHFWLLKLFFQVYYLTKVVSVATLHRSNSRARKFIPITIILVSGECAVLVLHGMSQATACDGILYQFPAQDSLTNPTPGVLSI